MIKFIFKNPCRGLTFSRVLEDQFFIDIEGRLCQKMNDTTYNVLANSYGKPMAFSTIHIDPEDAITMILDHVDRIEWE